jgi:putative ATPase
LSSLELAADAASTSAGDPSIGVELVERILVDAHLLYDRAGEEHFNLASALHKSVRNSDVQATCYWLARMLEAGEDPIYVARRLTRMASEDIGLADPQALVQCVTATRAVEFMGMPECALALLQAAVYCARAAKSNALDLAYGRAVEKIMEGHRDPVPLHLRNAVTDLMRQQGYGAGYAYVHDDPELSAAMQCLPESLRDAVFYVPKADSE